VIYFAVHFDQHKARAVEEALTAVVVPDKVELYINQEVHQLLREAGVAVAEGLLLKDVDFIVDEGNERVDVYDVHHAPGLLGLVGDHAHHVLDH